MMPDWVDWRWNLRSMLVITTLTSPLMHTPCTVAASERKTRNHLGLLNLLRKGRGRQGRNLDYRPPRCRCRRGRPR